MPLEIPSAPSRPAPPSFVARLASHGDRVALVSEDREWSYGDLARRVEHVAARLGAVRRLVLVEADNRVGAVVGYLAGLAAGCPVLLAPATALASLTAAYDPDVVLSAAGGWEVYERRAGTAHVLHEDLALLLSTSGSTGSPKLVRLSHRNLEANAQAIASYLDLRPTDRAATTLPLGYCYGLSVLNSHLERGAGLLLTGLSVVDACFWELFRRHGATSLAGVPHTFDLLERVGFAEMDLPSLRCVTQAGGRLAPERVRALAEVGQRRGWDLYVMYGQTEATARMAYLPPSLAADHPGSIGRPVPGGSFALEPVDGAEPDVGELVYRGPNVMLGYASTPADLGLGRTVSCLRTGDLARRNAAGLYEVVGRRSRMSKVFGLRIDLQRVEDRLSAAGVTACCAGGDGALVVVAEPAAGDVARLAAQAAGLPARAVRVVEVAALPRLPHGKPDLRAVAALAAERPAAPPPAPAPPADVGALCALYAEVLARDYVGPEDTFVGLGGDSLSYVEVSLRLEEALGALPAGWHTTPVRDLVAVRRRPGRVLETSVALRAAGIVLVVGSHANLMTVLGGAHVLLAVAGFNFARFCLGGDDASRKVLRAAGRLAGPAVACIAVAAAVTERYTLTNALLLNGVLGPDRWGPTWHFWFVEVLLYLLLGAAALLAVPPVRRLEQRWPWGFALVVLAAGVASRFFPGWLPVGPDRIHSAHVLLWLFALGWAAARATTPARRALLTGVVLATVPGFFGDGRRETVVVVGLCLLLWTTGVRVPAAVARAAGLLAAASLHVYVTHWLVYPHLEVEFPLAATVASLAVGLLYREGEMRLRRVRSRTATATAGSSRVTPTARRSRRQAPSWRRASTRA